MHEAQSMMLEVLIFMPSTIDWTCFTEVMLRWLKRQCQMESGTDLVYSAYPVDLFVSGRAKRSI